MGNSNSPVHPSHRLQTERWPSDEMEACHWPSPLLLCFSFEPIPDVGIDQSRGQEDLQDQQGNKLRALAWSGIFPAVFLCSENNLSPLRGWSEWIVGIY